MLVEKILKTKTELEIRYLILEAQREFAPGSLPSVVVEFEKAIRDYYFDLAVHQFQLIFHLILLEQGQIPLILFYFFNLCRHQGFNKGPHGFKCFFPTDQNFINIGGKNIPQRPFNDITLFMD